MKILRKSHVSFLNAEICYQISILVFSQTFALIWKSKISKKEDLKNFLGCQIYFLESFKTKMILRLLEFSSIFWLHLQPIKETQEIYAMIFPIKQINHLKWVNEQKCFTWSFEYTLKQLYVYHSRFLISTFGELLSSIGYFYILNITFCFSLVVSGSEKFTFLQEHLWKLVFKLTK